MVRSGLHDRPHPSTSDVVRDTIQLMSRYWPSMTMSSSVRWVVRRLLHFYNDTLRSNFVKCKASLGTTGLITLNFCNIWLRWHICRVVFMSEVCEANFQVGALSGYRILRQSVMLRCVMYPLLILLSLRSQLYYPFPGSNFTLRSTTQGCRVLKGMWVQCDKAHQTSKSRRIGGHCLWRSHVWEETQEKTSRHRFMSHAYQKSCSYRLEQLPTQKLNGDTWVKSDTLIWEVGVLA